MKFTTRPVVVDAFRLPAEDDNNFDEFVIWAHRLGLTFERDQLPCSSGEWIVVYPSGLIRVCTDDEFRDRFDRYVDLPDQTNNAAGLCYRWPDESVIWPVTIAGVQHWRGMKPDRTMLEDPVTRSALQFPTAKDAALALYDLEVGPFKIEQVGVSKSNTLELEIKATASQ